MLILGSTFFQLVADQFKHTSWQEWVGVISGFVCIYLATKENVLSWPISIISVVAYAWVFLGAKMYGDMALQVYFLSTAFYGWYYWLKKQDSDTKPITSLPARSWLLIIGAIFVLSIALGFFLDKCTDTNVPYEDGFCTAMSFVAQLMLTRKILQSWVLWIIVDLCYIPLYIYKNLNLSAVFYAFLVAIAIKGYLDWRRTYREQTN